jgi:transforming acidic coiled-coil-containing protein 3
MKLWYWQYFGYLSGFFFNMFSIIMEEYEKTISRLVAEKEQERQAHELDKSALLKDRDAAMGHLANIEIAFSDLHK